MLDNIPPDNVWAVENLRQNLQICVPVPLVSKILCYVYTTYVCVMLHFNNKQRLFS